MSVSSKNSEWRRTSVTVTCTCIHLHFVSVNDDWINISVMKLKPLFSFIYVETHWQPIAHGATVVVIVWYLELQLPMQSVPINTSVVIQHYAIFAAGRWFSPGTPVSSTNKTNCHDITEILLKVALNTITLTLIPIDHVSLTLDFD